MGRCEVSTAPISNVITERILAWLLSRREPVAPVDAATGRHLMPYSPIFRRVTLLFLVVSAGFLILGTLGTLDDPKALMITSIIFGLMFGSSVWAFYEAHFVTIGFSREGIFRRGLGQEVSAPWFSVTRVDFSESMKWFRFRTHGHGTIRVSVYRNGLGTLTDFVGTAALDTPADDAARILREQSGFPAANPRAA